MCKKQKTKTKNTNARLASFFSCAANRDCHHQIMNNESSIFYLWSSENNTCNVRYFFRRARMVVLRSTVFFCPSFSAICLFHSPFAGCRHVQTAETKPGKQTKNNSVSDFDWLQLKFRRFSLVHNSTVQGNLLRTFRTSNAVTDPKD